MKPEYRYTPLDTEAEGGNLTGVVIKYGAEARMAGFRERFESGSLEYSDVIVTLHHRRDKPVARVGAGLTLTDSPEALRCVIDLPDTPIAAECRDLVKAGILRGLSIEFFPVRERWEKDLRIIERAKLPAFSVVDKPAYIDSKLSMRARPIHVSARPHQRKRFY